MAKIFISYSQKDKRVVQQYVQFLEKYDQQILMDETVLTPGDDMQKKLMEAQQEADGTIVFITPNSIESAHVNSEIGLARAYKDKEDKFLIPLVKGDLNVPYIIKDLNYVKIDNKTVEEIVQRILDVIDGVRPQKRGAKTITTQSIKKDIPRSNASIPNDVTSNIVNDTEDVVKEIQTTLRALNIFHSQIDGIAGPATTKAIEGFQALYHLPVTREWDEQTKRKADEILKSREVKQETPSKEIKEEIPAEEIKQEQEQSPTNPEPKYWLLKIYGDDWDLGNLSIGNEGYFNAHFNNYQPRTEYEDFKSVKKGELGFGYDYSSQKSIVFSYEVTESLHEDPDRGEIFNFKITRFFDPVIPLTEFISLIGVADELQSDSLKKLFALTKKRI